MSARTATNVVPFGPPESAQLSRQDVEAHRLLETCRDHLVEGVAKAFSRNLGHANDDLLAMADRATSLQQQQLHFAAFDFLAKRGQLLLQGFRSAFVAQFDSGISALRGTTSPREAQRNASELSLVTTDDFERDLAIGKLSARAVCNSAQQLTALDRRLASLLRIPRLAQENNPLNPRAVLTSLLAALADMDAGDQMALLLLHVFDRQVSVQLPAIYSEIDRHLVDSGILPELPAERPRPVQRPEPTDQSQPSASGAPVAGHGTEPGAGQATSVDAGGQARTGLAQAAPGQMPASDEDVFAKLVQALQAAAALQAQSLPSVGPGGYASGQPANSGLGSLYAQQLGAYPTPSTPRRNMDPAQSVAQLIDALSSLQHRRASPTQLRGIESLRIDPGHDNVLQQIRSTQLATESHPVDALTIDIVAMLFDAIFNDPDLPATLRAEIAKLQIPVLKVALMDKAFFSNKKHPTRRLLDAIASAGIGRSDIDADRMAAKIRDIVDEVVSSFETDVDIFESQVDKLEEFLHEEDARARAQTDPVVDRLAQRDRQELGRSRASMEIESRVRNGKVPALVADFLSRHWRPVLAESFVQGGDQGTQWVEALGTMDDLIWSVEPKSAEDERSRLMTLLPDLLKRLRLGLESNRLAGAWDPFFAQLIRLHMEALRTETDDSEESAFAEPPDEPTAAAPAAQTVPISARPARAETPTAAAQTPSARTSVPAPAPAAQPTAVPGDSGSKESEQVVDRHQELAQSLKVGAWVEFQSARGTRKTLRLSWVSDFRGVCLFTNRQGENALTLATTSLADHFRSGRARMLSPDPLVERAVAHVMIGVGGQQVTNAS